MTNDANDANNMDDGHRRDPRDANPSPPDEAPLRAAFAAMREHEAARAPSFERVVSGRATRGAGAPRRSRGWLTPAMALGAVAVVAVALATWRNRTPDRSSTTATAPSAAPALAFVPGSLRVPTDYFLDLATAPTTDEVPSIGDIDWYPLVPADDRGTPASTRPTAPTSHDSMTHGVPNTRRRN